MHIAEGVLSPAVLGAGSPGGGRHGHPGLRRLDYDRLMTVGILSAAFLWAH